MENKQLVEDAIQGDKWSLGRLITIFEDNRQSSLIQRKEIIQQLSSSSQHKQKLRQARFIGFTGAPGVGKSSLIGSLAQYILKADDNIRLSVLAIDPSSR